MNPLRKSLTEHFDKKYKERDFFDRYLAIYFLALIVGIGCLIWSAFASFKFYESYLNTFDDPVWNRVFAGFLTVFQSIIIGGLVGSVIRDFFRGQWDMMTSIFAIVSILVMGWNVYADYQGVPELALSWTEAPVDSKTSTTDQVYDNQVADAKADIQRYQDRIAFVKGNCKNEDCWVDGGKAYWKGNLTKFGKQEIRKMQDQIEVKDAEIREIRKAWNNQRNQHTEEHTAALATYQTKLNRKTSTLRGIVLILLLVYISCSIFTGYFGARIRQSKGKPKKKPMPRPDLEAEEPEAPAVMDRDKDLEMEFLYEEIAKLKSSINQNGSASGKH